MNDEKINIEVNKVIKPNQVKELPNMGMKKMNGQRGKLIIEFKINFPNELNENKKENQRNFKLE